MIPPNFQYELEQPFLTIAPVCDRQGRRILLLHSDSLTESLDDQVISSTIKRIRPSAGDVLIYLNGGIGMLLETTSLAKVRTFRRLVDIHLSPNDVPRTVYALHVSFVARAHAALVARFAGPAARAMFAATKYVDLVEDLERELRFDAVLLGLRHIDVHYDDVMRAWVGRKHGGVGIAAGADTNQHNKNNVSSASLTSIASHVSSGSAYSTDFEEDEITPVYTHDNHIANKTPYVQQHFSQTTIDPSKPLIDINAISFDTDSTTPAPAQQRFAGDNV